MTDALVEDQCPHPGRVDRNWTESDGEASWPKFLSVGEPAQAPHSPEEMTPPSGFLHLA